MSFYLENYNVCHLFRNNIFVTQSQFPYFWVRSPEVTNITPALALSMGAAERQSQMTCGQLSLLRP